MRPSQTILVLEDLRKLCAGPVHRNGFRLESDDTETVMDIYQQWLLLMLDLGYLHHVTLKRDAQRLLSDMVKADVLVLNNAFAELLHRVRCQDFKGFKALCRPISSHLYPLIKDDVNKLSESDVYAAKRLIAIFSYTSRLTLHKIDLTQECLDAYMAVEDSISDYLPRHLVSDLNKIIRRWLTSFDPTRLHFKHGPGGVAGHGRTSLQSKYKDLTYDARTSYVFGEPHWCQSPIRSSLDRISSTIFVPKSYKTFRTISMEPSTLQYLQQGVWSEIDRVVGSSGYLRNRIGFHEQERNQRLARDGSISRNYATIDLSAASDSVSYKLVKRLFRKTALLPYLIATRSDRTLLPDGRLIDLKKFAPMGSALCFPVETIVFAAICQYVTREHGVTGDYSVFGDDIIVPTQCVEDVILILETLGFSVNRSKSFYHRDCWFRESCGAEYCDGFDVTPMRVSRKYKSEDKLLHLVGLIQLANNAYDRGFVNLRHFFIRKLRKSRYKMLFAPTELKGESYTNFHLKSRWNSDLQRNEFKATGFKVKPPKKQDESIRLRHWYESTHQRTDAGDGFVSRIDRVTVSVKDRWRAAPIEDLDQVLLQIARR